MAVYIIAREGVWPLHNYMRAPILIDTGIYSNGYLRDDYRRMDILHDEGSWFLVYMEGDSSFEEAHIAYEPLCDSTIGALLIKVYTQADSEDETLRTTIAQSVRNYVRNFVTDDEILVNFNDTVEQTIINNVYDRDFVFVRPTNREIIERNLRP